VGVNRLLTAWSLTSATSF